MSCWRFIERGTQLAEFRRQRTRMTQKTDRSRVTCLWPIELPTARIFYNRYSCINLQYIGRSCCWSNSSVLSSKHSKLLIVSLVATVSNYLLPTFFFSAIWLVFSRPLHNNKSRGMIRQNDTEIANSVQPYPFGHKNKDVHSRMKRNTVNAIFPNGLIQMEPWIDLVTAHILYTVYIRYIANGLALTLALGYILYWEKSLPRLDFPFREMYSDLPFLKLHNLQDLNLHQTQTSGIGCTMHTWICVEADGCHAIQQISSKSQA